MEIYIDGYNLLHMMADPHADEKASRKELLKEIEQLLSAANYTATIVLEAKLDNTHLCYSISTRSGPLTILDPPAGVSADEYLIERAASHKEPNLLLIITNDKQIQRAVQQSGVRYQEVKPFLRWLKKRGSQQQEEVKKLPRLQEDCDALLFEMRYRDLQNKKDDV